MERPVFTMPCHWESSQKLFAWMICITPHLTTSRDHSSLCCCEVEACSCLRSLSKKASKGSVDVCGSGVLLTFCMSLSSTVTRPPAAEWQQTHGLAALQLVSNASPAPAGCQNWLWIKTRVLYPRNPMGKNKRKLNKICGQWYLADLYFDPWPSV